MSFSEASVIKKIQELNNTQQSVQTLSLWLIHHRKHAKSIVQIWLKELLNESKCERKLTYIYLANDILQNSRKKSDLFSQGTEYINEFVSVLYEAMQNTGQKADDKIRFTLERILNIWKDRKLFTDEVIDKYRHILHHPDRKVEINTDDNILRSPVASNQLQKSLSPANTDANVSPTETQKKRKLISQLKDELFSTTDEVKAPDASKLIAMLQDLEKSASSDAIVRQKISELPAQISDLNSLGKINSRQEAYELEKQVKEAVELLDEYNKRLQDELINRKKVALLLNAFIKQQQAELDTDRTCLDDWNHKSKNVQSVKNELEIHAKNLPDLKMIDDIAQLPLPSPTDLFA